MTNQFGRSYVTLVECKRVWMAFGLPFSSYQREISLLYPDSGISMDEEIVLGDMIWSYNKAEL